MNQLSSLSNYWHIAMMILTRFTGWKWISRIDDQGCSKPFEVNHGHFFGGKMARLISLTSHVSEYLGCWEQR
jgi:hypothetical protein